MIRSLVGFALSMSALALFGACVVLIVVANRIEAP